MRRRTVLASLGASATALAGCQAPGSPESTTTGTRTPTTCDSPEPRSVRLADTGSVPADADLSVSVTPERTRTTADAPARFRVAVANDGPSREIDVTDDGDCHLLNRDRGRSDPNGLWLYRTESAPTDRAGECWTRDLPPRDRVGFDGYGCGRRAFESGESIATTYEVWDDYATEGYLRRGTYRFDVSIAVWDDRGATATATESTPTVLDWWFELSVATLDA